MSIALIQQYLQCPAHTGPAQLGDGLQQCW